MTLLHKKPLIISHCNVRSLLSPGTLDEISVLIENHKIDILSISETWLDSHIPDQLVSLHGFTITRKDRNRKGGGVLVYVSDLLTVTHLPRLEHEHIESLWVSISKFNKTIILGTYYRPPGQLAEERTQFLDLLSQSIEDACLMRSDAVILLGDFNDRCTSWDSLHDNSELGSNLVNLFTTHCLSQLVSSPTRVTHANASLLDLFVTNNPTCVNNVIVLPPLAKCDHSPILSELHFQSSVLTNCYKRKIWHYSRTDLARLMEALHMAPWHVANITSDDIDDLVSYWELLFHEIISAHIPNSNVTIRPKDKPWISNSLRALIRKRNQLWRRYRRSKNINHYNIFKRVRNNVVSLNRKCLHDYTHKMTTALSAQGQNIKKFWSYSKALLGKNKASTIPYLLVNGRTISTSVDKATKFNKYFSEQCTLPKSSLTHPLPRFQYVTNTRLSTVPISPEDVHEILSQLDINKSVGPDGISNRILRLAADSISVPLANIFQQSILSSTYPSTWKCANVTPVYKKNDRCNVENYRPISLLCNVSKVFERLVYNTVYKYLTLNKLLTPKNSGFKKGDSTICQLISICHKIHLGLENQKHVRMVFLDASKAFDKVWHRGLIFKLEQLGIVDPLLSWFRSYLSDRKQRVVLDGQASDWTSIDAGVPQGSILGPLLFLVYVNDICFNIKSDINLFADDTSLLSITDNPVTAARELNADLRTLQVWASQWFLYFNTTKTVSLCFSPISHNLPSLYLNDVSLLEVMSHSHLGIILAPGLSWKPHVDHIIKKASQRLGMLQAFKYKLSRTSIDYLYKTLVLSLLDYGDVLYDGCAQQQADTLNALQSRAARIVSGCLQSSNTENLLNNELGWETLVRRRHRHKLCLLYKTINGLAPEYLYELLPLTRSSGAYSLKNPLNFKLYPCKTAKFKSSYFPASVSSWNSLPTGVKKIPTYSAFSNALKRMSLPPQPPDYFNLGPRYPSVLLARMRLCSSTLNHHLFKIGVSSSPACACGHQNESNIHYLFYCPIFTQQRHTLFGDLSNFIGNYCDVNMMLNSAPNTLLRYILYGSLDWPADVNIRVFQAVFKYLINSKRFIIN